jgi:hypothetical protein
LRARTPLAIAPSMNFLRSPMIRAAVLCIIWILFLSEPTSGAEVAASNSCPRPSDQRGPLYETITGAFRSRGVSAGGGKFVTIPGIDRAGPISVSVVGKAFDSTKNLAVGTRITLVGCVSNSMSGAQPPYSCIELAP